MRQVFYIEADEEMISVIGRLRRSTATENVIVAPYRAHILQSIVNLRLLIHDARKNGKEIVVVTQDEQSRLLCERAGIRAQASIDGEDMRTGQIASQRSSGAVVPTMPVAAENVSDGSESHAFPDEKERGNSDQPILASKPLPRSDTIGSSGFFANPEIPTPPFAQSSAFRQARPAPDVSRSAELSQQPVPIESLSRVSYGDVKRIAVRDKNPKRLTTLNSKRFEEESLQKQQKSFTPPSLRGASSVRPVFAPAPSSVVPQSAFQTQPSQQKVSVPVFPSSSYKSAPIPEETSHVHFPESFSRSHANRNASVPERKLPENQVSVSGGGKMKAFFVFFGIVSVLSVAGVGAYLFLPKADIRVRLKVSSQQADFQFDGSSDAVASADARTIPVRLIEKDQEVSLSFDATGKASLADQKSRGSVTVYNEYSADPQVLVASTRLMSEDGKVFRLLSTVTVPGMTASGAGTAEASVTADASGQEYNLAPTSFRIPGFQGGPKYDKFYAKSSKAMTGGGTGGSDVAAVSDTDVAAAKKAMEAKAQALASDIARQEAADGEGVLDEAVESTIVSSGAFPQVGAVTDSFDYRIKIHVKAFVYSETDLKNMIGTLLARQDASKGVRFASDAIELQYGEPTADFAAKTLRIKVHAIGRSESSLDKEQLKSDLLGQDDSAVDGILRKYPQVETISVNRWPEFVSTKIPARADRVTVEIDPIASEGGK